MSMRILGSVTLVLCAIVMPGYAQPIASRPLAHDHRAIQAGIRTIQEIVDSLPQSPPGKQRWMLEEVSRFLRSQLRPHSAWEEKELYPSVNRHAGTSACAFTSTMRYEHRIMNRWIDDLDIEAGKRRPDILLFARRANHLLGLLTAHFEVEEEVLLPMLERSPKASQAAKHVW